MNNIVYATNDKYAPYLGVSLLSFLKNNKETENINIFIINSDISDQNKNKLKNLCKNFQTKLTFISMQKVKEKINKYSFTSNYPFEIFAPIFLSTLLPNSINKAIFLDADTLINDSINELWDLDISNYYCAGVLDIVSDELKSMINFPENFNYINSGFLICNLKKWREDRIEEKCYKIFKKEHDNLNFPDQDIINLALKNNVLILPLEYNLLTLFIEIPYEKIKKVENFSPYYTKNEVNKAITNPKIYHFCSMIYGKPWIKNIDNPLYFKYKTYADKSPWKNEIFQENNSFLKGKLGRFIYKNFPLITFKLYKHCTDIYDMKQFKKKIKLLKEYL